MTEDLEKPERPVLEPDMAQYLVETLDCKIPLKGHAARNQFAACVNCLIEIANWKESE